MKKRILSFVLALALAVTLIPLGGMTARAASEMTASAELVEIIKKWEGFAATPFWDYGQWSVGYGTKAPDENLERYRTEGISEEEATQLLNTYLESMGKSVNSFIDKYGLSVTQGQFDAMLSLTYNCGSRWMVQTSTLRTAIVEGWTGDDLLFAFGQWSTAGGTTLSGLVRRRMAEVNMYLNGQYSATPPAEYCYVNFDSNGGIGEIITQAFIAGDSVQIRAKHAYEGCVFAGWHTDPTGGEKIETLDSSLNGYTLYAHWTAGEGADQPQDTVDTTITGTAVSYERQVVSQTLNVFQQPVKGALVVDALAQGNVVAIVAEYKDSSGATWGKVENLGWINLDYTQEPVEEDTSNAITVTVTGTDVNVRRGPSTSYGVVGKVTVGDQLAITSTTTGGGYTWGKFDKGWIALKYTNYDDAVNGSLESDGSAQTSVMGTVNVQEFLRIRGGAGVTYSVVGMLGPNDRVEILEKKAVGGTIWGRIDKGWISLDYVILDAENPSNTEALEETQPEATQPEATQPEATEPEKDTVQETVEVTGTVKLTSGRLNIRTGPSTGYSVAGSYSNGTAVTILEQKTVGTVTWGRTDKGWISLDYVTLNTGSAQQPPQTEQDQQPTTGTTENTATSNAVTGTVSLTSGCLRIRSGAGTNNAIVGNLYNGAAVTITEQTTVNGTVWGKIDRGWISLDYVKLSSSGGSSAATGNTGTPDSATAQEQITGRVNVNDYLRVRSGAGTNYSIVGYYYKDNKVTITERKTVGGTVWGRTDKGWISLDYVILDGQGESTDNMQTDTITGVVTLTSGVLRIRSAAGTGNRIVGSLSNGAKVTILETTTVDGVQWGRIEKGWICMDYVKVN